MLELDDLCLLLEQLLNILVADHGFLVVNYVSLNQKLVLLLHFQHHLDLLLLRIHLTLHLFHLLLDLLNLHIRNYLPPEFGLVATTFSCLNLVIYNSLFLSCLLIRNIWFFEILFGILGC